MKNDLLPCFDKKSNKFAGQLFVYETKPSGHIFPDLKASTEFVFDDGIEACQFLYDKLDPDVAANTNWPLYTCPECLHQQETNGLIAWCDKGHIYNIEKTDPRFSSQ